jgi:hypothetical protein
MNRFTLRTLATTTLAALAATHGAFAGSLANTGAWWPFWSAEAVLAALTLALAALVRRALAPASTPTPRIPAPAAPHPSEQQITRNLRIRP